MTGAVAQLHLAILATLNGACTVAVVAVHIQDVLIGKTAVPLMNTRLADFLVVLNVTLGDVSSEIFKDFNLKNILDIFFILK